jgi:hypothetical protein
MSSIAYKETGILTRPRTFGSSPHRPVTPPPKARTKDTTENYLRTGCSTERKSGDRADILQIRRRQNLPNQLAGHR